MPNDAEFFEGKFTSRRMKIQKCIIFACLIVVLVWIIVVVIVIKDYGDNVLGGTNAAFNIFTGVAAFSAMTGMLCYRLTPSLRRKVSTALQQVPKKIESILDSGSTHYFNPEYYEIIDGTYRRIANPNIQVDAFGLPVVDINIPLASFNMKIYMKYYKTLLDIFNDIKSNAIEDLKQRSEYANAHRLNKKIDLFYDIFKEYTRIEIVGQTCMIVKTWNGAHLLIHKDNYSIFMRDIVNKSGWKLNITELIQKQAYDYGKAPGLQWLLTTLLATGDIYEEHPEGMELYEPILMELWVISRVLGEFQVAHDLFIEFLRDETNPFSYPYMDSAYCSAMIRTELVRRLITIVMTITSYAQQNKVLDMYTFYDHLTGYKDNQKAVASFPDVFGPIYTSTHAINKVKPLYDQMITGGLYNSTLSKMKIALSKFQPGVLPDQIPIKHLLPYTKYITIDVGSILDDHNRNVAKKTSIITRIHSSMASSKYKPNIEIGNSVLLAASKLNVSARKQMNEIPTALRMQNQRLSKYLKTNKSIVEQPLRTGYIPIGITGKISDVGQTITSLGSKIVNTSGSVSSSLKSTFGNFHPLTRMQMGIQRRYGKKYNELIDTEEGDILENSDVSHQMASVANQYIALEKIKLAIRQQINKRRETREVQMKLLRDKTTPEERKQEVEEERRETETEINRYENAMKIIAKALLLKRKAANIRKELAMKAIDQGRNPDNLEKAELPAVKLEEEADKILTEATNNPETNGPIQNAVNTLDVVTPSTVSSSEPTLLGESEIQYMSVGATDPSSEIASEYQRVQAVISTVRETVANAKTSQAEDLRDINNIQSNLTSIRRVASGVVAQASDQAMDRVSPPSAPPVVAQVVSKADDIAIMIDDIAIMIDDDRNQNIERDGVIAKEDALVENSVTKLNSIVQQLNDLDASAESQIPNHESMIAQRQSFLNNIRKETNSLQRSNANLIELAVDADVSKLSRANITEKDLEELRQQVKFEKSQSMRQLVSDFDSSSDVKNLTEEVNSLDESRREVTSNLQTIETTATGLQTQIMLLEANGSHLDTKLNAATTRVEEATNNLNQVLDKANPIFQQFVQRYLISSVQCSTIKSKHAKTEQTLASVKLELEKLTLIKTSKESETDGIVEEVKSMATTLMTLREQQAEVAEYVRGLQENSLRSLNQIQIQTSQDAAMIANSLNIEQAANKEELDAKYTQKINELNTEYASAMNALVGQPMQVLKTQQEYAIKQNKLQEDYQQETRTLLNKATDEQEALRKQLEEITAQSASQAEQIQTLTKPSDDSYVKSLENDFYEQSSKLKNLQESSRVAIDELNNKHTEAIQQLQKRSGDDLQAANQTYQSLQSNINHIMIAMGGASTVMKGNGNIAAEIDRLIKDKTDLINELESDLQERTFERDAATLELSTLKATLDQEAGIMAPILQGKDSEIANLHQKIKEAETALAEKEDVGSQLIKSKRTIAEMTEELNALKVAERKFYAAKNEMERNHESAVEALNETIDRQVRDIKAAQNAASECTSLGMDLSTDYPDPMTIYGKSLGGREVKLEGLNSRTVNALIRILDRLMDSQKSVVTVNNMDSEKEIMKYIMSHDIFPDRNANKVIENQKQFEFLNSNLGKVLVFMHSLYLHFLANTEIRKNIIQFDSGVCIDEKVIDKKYPLFKAIVVFVERATSFFDPEGQGQLEVSLYRVANETSDISHYIDRSTGNPKLILLAANDKLFQLGFMNLNTTNVPSVSKPEPKRAAPKPRKPSIKTEDSILDLLKYMNSRNSSNDMKALHNLIMEYEKLEREVTKNEFVDMLQKLTTGMKADSIVPTAYVEEELAKNLREYLEHIESFINLYDPSNHNSYIDMLEVCNDVEELKRKILAIWKSMNQKTGA